MVRKKTHEEFVQEVFELVGNEYEVTGKYEFAWHKIMIKHQKCGKEFEVVATKFLVGNRCGYCSNLSRTKKHEINFLREVYELVGNEYSVLEKYVNTKTKIKMAHNVCGHKWDVSPFRFLGGSRCPGCSKPKKINSGRRKTHYEFVKEIENTFGVGQYKILSEYRNTRTHVIFQHLACGHKWSTTPGIVLSRKHSKNKQPPCPKCNRRYKPSQKEWEKEVLSLGKGQYQSMKAYQSSGKKTEISHVTCGKTFSATPNSFRKGTRCPHCAGRYSWTSPEYKEKVKEETNGEYEVLSDYNNSIEKVIFLHNECENKFEMAPSNFNAGIRCPHCNESKGEKRIRNFLVRSNILFTPQYKFEDLYYKSKAHPLKFDFAIFTNNEVSHQPCLIEYDGKQHYEPIEIFGGEKAFKDNQRRDKAKNKYCLNNNIPILRIPYTEFDRIEEILTEFLSEFFPELNLQQDPAAGSSSS